MEGGEAHRGRREDKEIKGDGKGRMGVEKVREKGRFLDAKFERIGGRPLKISKETL